MKPAIVACALAASALVAGAASATPTAPAPTSAGPTSAGPSVDFGWQGSTGWLPLELRSDHHVYLKLEANGHAATAMIDPNIPHTTLDAAFARRIGLQPGEPLALGWPRLAIGGLAPTVRDLAPLQASLDHPVDVIIGADALSQVIADIDLPGHRFSLDRPSGYAFPSVARYTHLERNGDVWLAPVSIEGHRTALFALDFLTSDTLQIAPDYARSLALAPAPDRAAPDRAPPADDGAAQDGRVLLGQMKFVGVVSTKVRADVPGRLRPAYAGKAQGALGVGTLRSYRMIVDLRHDRLYSLLVDQVDPTASIFTLMRPPTPGNATNSFLPKPAGGF